MVDTTTTHPNSNNHRKRFILTWVGIILVVVIAFLGLSQCHMPEKQVREAFIATCLQNTALLTDTTDSSKHQVASNPSKPSLDAYCECTWNATLGKMDASQLHQFSQQTQQQQILLLGGKEVLDKIHQTCLKNGYLN